MSANNLPTISGIGNQVIWNGGPSLFDFTVGDTETSASQLTVTASSSNTDVIPVNNLTFTGTGANRTLVITPVLSSEGSSLVTLTVKDSDQGETTVNFSVIVTKRRVYIPAIFTNQGETIELLIKFSSQGNEGGLTFSLNFDPTVFTFGEIVGGSSFAPDSPFETLRGQVPTFTVDRTGEGLVGYSFSFLSSTLPAGELEIAKVTLAIASTATEEDLTISFADEPVERLASSAFPNIAPVVVAFQDVSVTFQTGLEGDVFPRSPGEPDGKVNLFDWLTVGSFSAKLNRSNPVTTPAEFQRADTFPKVVAGQVGSGDGKINLFDWLITGSYSAKLDRDIPAAGGPVGDLPFPAPLSTQREGLPSDSISDAPARISGRFIEQKDEVRYIISLESSGNLAAASFSLWFDPKRFDFLEGRLAYELDEVVWFRNENSIEEGELGVTVSQVPGRTFPKGKFELLEVRLKSRSIPLDLARAIRFQDRPLERIAAGMNADAIELIFQTGGYVSEGFVFALESAENGSVEFRLEALSGRLVSVDASEDLEDWHQIWSGEVPEDGRLKVVDNGVAHPQHRFYRVREADLGTQGNLR